MEPVLEVPNVINVFSTTVLNGKRKREKGIFIIIIIIIIIIYFIYPRKEHRSKDLILKRKNTTTIKVLFLCEFVTDLASKTTPFLWLQPLKEHNFGKTDKSSYAKLKFILSWNEVNSYHYLLPGDQPLLLVLQVLWLQDFPNEK